MSLNIEYLFTRSGILKIITLVFGIIAVSVGFEAHVDSPYTTALEYIQRNATLREEFKDLPRLHLETYFVVNTLNCLCASFFYLCALAFVAPLEESVISRYVDTGYHIFASIILFVSGFLIIYSAVNINTSGCPRLMGADDSVIYPYSSHPPLVRNLISSLFDTDENCQYMAEKIVAGIFALLNSVLYSVTAAVIYKEKDIDKDESEA